MYTVIALSCSAAAVLGIFKYWAILEKVDSTLYSKEGIREVSKKELDTAWAKAKRELFWWPFVKGEKSR